MGPVASGSLVRPRWSSVRKAGAPASSVRTWCAAVLWPHRLLFVRVPTVGSNCMRQGTAANDRHVRRVRLGGSALPPSHGPLTLGHSPESRAISGFGGAECPGAYRPDPTFPTKSGSGSGSDRELLGLVRLLQSAFTWSAPTSMEERKGGYSPHTAA